MFWMFFRKYYFDIFGTFMSCFVLILVSCVNLFWVYDGPCIFIFSIIVHQHCFAWRQEAIWNIQLLLGFLLVMNVPEKMIDSPVADVMTISLDDSCVGILSGGI